jgi:hypothetical protein
MQGFIIKLMPKERLHKLQNKSYLTLTLNLPMTTIVTQPFNVIKWQLKFNTVA